MSNLGRCWGTCEVRGARARSSRSHVSKHRAPHITQAPATPLAFPNTARPMFTQAPATPLAFPNTARPIVLKRLLRLSRFQTPRTLCLLKRLLRLSRFQTLRTLCLLKRLLRLSRFQTLLALYYSSACYASRVSKHRAPYSTQAPATPLAFPNTARPILLKRLLRLSRFQTLLALYYSSACYASRVSKHCSPYSTQAPATPLAFPNTARPIVLKRLLRLSRFQTLRAL